MALLQAQLAWVQAAPGLMRVIPHAHDPWPTPVQAKMCATPGVLAGDCIVTYDGHEYALPMEPLHEAWEAGLLPILQGPMELAQTLRSLMQPIQQEMHRAKMEAAAAAAAAAAAPPPKPGVGGPGGPGAGAAAGPGGGSDRMPSRLSSPGSTMVSCSSTFLCFGCAALISTYSYVRLSFPCHNIFSAK
eukprot:1160936-Pelagomonas_calceolata.AAC.17